MRRQQQAPGWCARNRLPTQSARDQSLSLSRARAHTLAAACRSSACSSSSSRAAFLRRSMTRVYDLTCLLVNYQHSQQQTLATRSHSASCFCHAVCSELTPVVMTTGTQSQSLSAVLATCARTSRLSRPRVGSFSYSSDREHVLSRSPGLLHPSSSRRYHTREMREETGGLGSALDATQQAAQHQDDLRAAWFLAVEKGDLAAMARVFTQQPALVDATTTTPEVGSPPPPPHQTRDRTALS